jgi:glycosyltransferase involved in cell wall biosynthesis
MPFERRAPTISVLLPIHNAERYVRKAVESVLSQTFDDFEVLAIDDGSTDGSLTILRDLERHDSRLVVRSRENRGLVPTLNELIDNSSAPYLARMDGDDICSPQRFEKQVAHLNGQPDCVAVGSRVLLIDPEGLPICETANELSHEDIEAALLAGSGGFRGICHPTVLMRREAVLKAGKYRDEYRFAEDLDFFLRLVEIGKLATISEILLSYRQHFKSAGYAHREEQQSAARRALEAARKRRGMISPPEIQASVAERQAFRNGHRKWAWWALAAGNLGTARKHALKAIAQDPFDIENLRVAICALRGR